MKKKTLLLLFTGLALLLSIAFLTIDLDPEIWRYALSKRIPKLFVMIITGTAIALATLLFQTITNNRILTPSVLGMDAIYVFVQTMIVFIYGTISDGLPNEQLKFLLSLVAMIGFSFVLYRVMFRNKQNIYTLLLVGMVAGTFFRSATGFIQKIIDPHEFSLLQGKLFASFNNVQVNLIFIALIIFLLTIPFIYDYMKQLDVLLLGKEQAINLGVDYDKITQRIFMVVAVLISVATALVGPLSFLGLMVVNISYEIAKTYKHSMIAVMSILTSIIALVGGQLIIENIFNFNITLSVIINFVGGIYFVFLLMRERKA